MKPMSKELADLCDGRVSLRVRYALLLGDESDHAAVDRAREQLTSVNYRIQRLERARLAPSVADRGLRPRRKSDVPLFG